MKPVPSANQGLVYDVYDTAYTEPLGAALILCLVAQHLVLTLMTQTTYPHPAVKVQLGLCGGRKLIHICASVSKVPTRRTYCK